LFTIEGSKPEFTYKITKVFMEHLDELQEMFPQYKTLSREMAAQVLGAPLHEGSIKYFKEIGILKQDKSRNFKQLLRPHRTQGRSVS
jgi:TRAP-type uncharacterized transport system substrate-binding protein